MKITLQQNKWHGDEPVVLDLPENWEVIHETLGCDKHPKLDYAQIRAKIEQPIGSPSLAELAKGKKRVCIIFDDMSRPTPTKELAEPVLDILLENGVKKEDIIFICGTGNHGPLSRDDFAKKLGEKIVSEYFIYNHNPYDNLEKIGTAKRGFDVWFNKEVMQSDLVIGLGGMIPHGGNGFSGGYKILFPGVAGIETMTTIHEYGGKEIMDLIKQGGFKSPMGTLPKKGMRFEIEECGKMACEYFGTFFKVDCFVNTKSEIVEVFAGNAIDEYYEAAKVCKKYYEIDRPDYADIIIVNSNFKSNESNVAYGIALQCFMESEQKNGDIVLVNFAKSGQVVHFMISSFGKTTKGRLYTGGLKDPRTTGKTIYFSPYGDKNGMEEIGIDPERYVWANSWESVLENLTVKKENPRVFVIDEGAIISWRES